MSRDAPTIHSSYAEVWQLKDIKFGGRDLRIITQNFNGPCSFIAICNILILRGNIEILPRTRQNVSYEFLSQLVAEYLLMSSPNDDVSDALTYMPQTQKGMDLNPVFTAANLFHPSGAAGGELKLFEHVNIPLVHGWLVDPDSPEGPVMKRIQDYDTAVALIAEVDHLTNGKFVVSDTEPVAGSSSNSPASLAGEFKEEDLQKIRDATVVRRFLDTTWSQLTYHGLFHLATHLPPNTPCALFRSSHLSVVYRHAPNAVTSSNAAGSSSSQFLAGSSSQPAQTSPEGAGDSALFTLVTDQAFCNEPSVVWERLEDVDGGWSTFVDSDFIKSSPAGGDFAGQTAEEALLAAEAIENTGIVHATDADLAQQLQVEEYQMAQRQQEVRVRQQEAREAARLAQEQAKAERKKKKKGDCIIM
ncbi:hypothetical protein D9613_010812 [Agrocybe pediades]|uniref:MINDY deubiquitinase domain-containing protein n=1 Tax=Agrocybe pediades TaxID=84607 RepID=A0A8H4VM38_9AGAR|nr:hypothetical protein D9613_010812 [Agrocybe pediades]KAF9564037.1 DUF544-domain-containing protein [Agrocybe pediades]